MPTPKPLEVLDAPTRDFYCHVLTALTAAGVPFLVGGAYALAHYTGIERHTKDLDVFVRPRDCAAALQALGRAGYRTELTFPHWLGKAFHADALVDVIFSSGNAVATVDDTWFAHAPTATVLGVRVKVCPAEEMIWQKVYVMERERFDGADVMHLLLKRGPELDWPRLLDHFATPWRLLLSYVVLYDFVYPSERDRIPARVRAHLLARAQQAAREPRPAARVCQGTLISREQYLPDVRRWGFADARDLPGGPMTPQQVEQWTAAIGQ